MLTVSTYIQILTLFLLQEIEAQAMIYIESLGEKAKTHEVELLKAEQDQQILYKTKRATITAEYDRKT